jgi:potassium channel subfamily K member 1
VASNCVYVLLAGYGHVSPLSNGGKVFCVIYAAVGIPLTLILFTALVERLMGVTSLLLSGLINGLGHLYRTVYIRLVHITIIFCFVLVFVFLIPSAVFTIIEHNWNFLDSFYYCFISMTTIGLGDYIPGDEPHQTYRPLYKICTAGKECQHHLLIRVSVCFV